MFRRILLLLIAAILFIPPNLLADTAQKETTKPAAIEKKWRQRFRPNLIQIAAPAVSLPLDSQTTATLKITLPNGRHLNLEAPMNVRVDGDDAIVASGPSGIEPGKSSRVSAPSLDLPIAFKTGKTASNGNLYIEATVGHCSEGANAVCEFATLEWTVPITLGAVPPTALNLEGSVKTDK